MTNKSEVFSQLDQLEAIARAATPERWCWGGTPCESQEKDLMICKENLEATKVPDEMFYEVFLEDGRRTALVGNGPTSVANAAFIATFDPAMVLELIQEIRRNHREKNASSFMSEDWTSLSIIYDENMDFPEEVAYGPRFMMDRLGKWLDKFMANEIKKKDIEVDGQDLSKGLVASGALRQYMHNDGSPGYLSGYDQEVTDKFIADVVSSRVRVALEGQSFIKKLTRYSMWSNAVAQGMDSSPNGEWVSFEELQDALAMQKGKP